MRTPIRRVATLVASLAFAACSSGTVIVVRRPTPPPPPPRPRIEPLDVTLARPVRGHLLVQTNRPSYVALFEIVPDRGVALLAPAYAHQRTWMLAGLNWVPISWKVQSTMYYGPPSGTAVPARWVYAIASDEPLRLPDEAFHPSYMRRVLGPAAYRATNPYVTMRAISRAFVPSVVDEAWAEDAYALAATYASDPYRTVRIYCSNRTVYDVPEEMADRAWCPVRGTSGGTAVISTPTRPDSIVASNGLRVRRRMPETTPVRGPIDRVTEPTRPENAPIADETSVPRHDPKRDVIDTKDVVKDATKERRGNGNAYGHTDDPNVKGRGIENEKQSDPRRTPETEKNKPEKDVHVKPDKDRPVEVPAHDPRREPRVDPPVDSKPESQPKKVEAKQEKQEDKQLRREEKQEEKAEKVEQKPEKPAVTVEPPREPDTPVSKPETKPDKKEEDRSVKPEEKQESKAEVKAETKEEKSEAKSEEKGGGKPEEKHQGKPDSEQPGKKGEKGKP
jgi:hypothetical protein